jgi:hypothetical protein
MTMEVRLRPEAEHDLAESAAWYEQQRTGLGQEFLDAALAAFSAITDIPNGFAVIHRSVAVHCCIDFHSPCSMSSIETGSWSLVYFTAAATHVFG